MHRIKEKPTFLQHFAIYMNNSFYDILRDDNGL